MADEGTISTVLFGGVTLLLIGMSIYTVMTSKKSSRKRRSWVK